jgi:DNA processing protein
MEQEILCRIALTKIPHIGCVHARTLIETFGDATSIFKSKISSLEKIEGIGTVRAASIKNFNSFNECEKEIKFTSQHQIQILFHTDKNYPRRLQHCHDAPILLYYKGNADVNATRILAIVGTRTNTTYGKDSCESILQELQKHDITTISGLAYGIDTIAHQTSLQLQLPTIAVLAHGLDRIYPYSNKKLAQQMIENGGLITSFGMGTIPDKQNFPSRNRITAGMADGLVIIETGRKGGSLITAEIAHSYNREIFAIPGRINDTKSAGCLELIKSQKALLISSAADIVDNLGWTTEKKSLQKNQQMKLFQELDAMQKHILGQFETEQILHMEQILMRTGLSGSSIASALLSLEMLDLIESIPGKRFRIK